MPRAEDAARLAAPDSGPTASVDRATSGAAPDTNSLTPAAVQALPDARRDLVVGAYNDALTPVFLILLPMVAVGLLVTLFIKEVPFRATLEDVDEIAGAEGVEDVLAFADLGR